MRFRRLLRLFEPPRARHSDMGYLTPRDGFGKNTASQAFIDPTSERSDSNRAR